MNLIKINVSVAYSPAPRQVDIVSLQMPAGATLIDALRASGLLHRHGLLTDDAASGAVPESLAVGIWMKKRPLETPLRDNDRVEIYRPLKVDPKEARRQRFRKAAR